MKINNIPGMWDLDPAKRLRVLRLLETGRKQRERARRRTEGQTI